MSVFSSSSRRAPAGRVRSPRRSSALSGTRIRELINAIALIEAEGGNGDLALGGNQQLEVTNLNKRFFPKRGFTKGDLMAYYASVSPYLLPAVVDRPLVMKRFPHGIGGQSFYQQRAPEDPPDPVRVEPVADEGLTTQERLIGGDLATLLYIVQLGAICLWCTAAHLLVIAIAMLAVSLSLQGRGSARGA